MKRTIITLIISVLVYITAYITMDNVSFDGSAFNALIQTMGVIASVGIVGSIVVLLYHLDETC